MAMAHIELPKDARGHEIPLDTKVLYNEDGKCFKVNRFTYSVVQTMPGLKWGVVFMDCLFDYCSSFYLAPPEPPDSWEKLEEDLGRGMTSLNFNDAECDYYDRGSDYGRCKGCPAEKRSSCTVSMLEDIATRIRKLRGED